LILLMVSALQKQVNQRQEKNFIIQKKIQHDQVLITQLKQNKQSLRQLTQRMQVIQSLQNSRSVLIQVLARLIYWVPQGAYLTSIQRRDSQVTLQGYAFSTHDISRMMQRIEKNSWIKDLQLSEVKRNKLLKQAHFNEFHMTFKLIERVG